MERKIKQMRGRYGVGNKIKMTSNVRSVIKIKSRHGHEALWWDEKTLSVNYCTNVSSLGNPKTLCVKLVRSKLKLTDNSERGNFSCGRGNCEICNILKPGKEFKKR